MAASPSQLLLMRWLLRAKQAGRQGFTLIELLVTLIVGTLIMGTLLYIVVEMMQANRREEVLTQTQQDMRRAIDFISRDVREAVFVYESPNAVVEAPAEDGTPGTRTLMQEMGITVNADLEITAPANLAGATPILAFWRLDPVPNDSAFWGQPCTRFPAGARRIECETLRLRQSYYTLVMYLQRPNDDDSIWSGPSRLLRYELPKYSISDIPDLTQRRGYSDPASGCNSFEFWSAPNANCDPGNVGAIAPTITVLTDHVDFTVAADTPDCAGDLIPADPRGFSVCVSDGDGAVDRGPNRNVRIFLQGNALEGRPGLITALSQASSLPVLESEVLVRGVLNKQPQGAQ